MPARGTLLSRLPGLFAALLLLASDSPARTRRFHQNPHAEVTAVARVETAPRRTTHSNGRSFEELRVLLLSTDPSEAGGLEPFRFDTRHPVRIVHDVSCGGVWVSLSPDDRVEVRGEYVHTGNGRDLIHFTHPADRSCGSGRHGGGYLRPAARARADTAGSGAAPAGISQEAEASFRSSLRPILSTKCAPCHEPGGKMYARLPFDDAGTVAAHAKKMAGRLSGEERRALEQWAAGLERREPR